MGLQQRANIFVMLPLSGGFAYFEASGCNGRRRVCQDLGVEEVVTLQATDACETLRASMSILVQGIMSNLRVMFLDIPIYSNSVSFGRPNAFSQCLVQMNSRRWQSQ